MAYNANKDLKKYYSIEEVATKFNVAESLLRYWEKEFPNIHPKRTGRNVRQYTLEDIHEIEVVYNLVKVRGMKLAAAKKVLSQNKEAASNISEMLTRLMSVRDELLSIDRELRDL